MWCVWRWLRLCNAGAYSASTPGTQSMRDPHVSHPLTKGSFCPSVFAGRDVTAGSTAAALPAAPQGMRWGRPSLGSSSPENPAAVPGSLFATLLLSSVTNSCVAVRKTSRFGRFFATSPLCTPRGCCCVQNRVLKMRKRGAGAGAGLAPVRSTRSCDPQAPRGPPIPRPGNPCTIILLPHTLACQRKPS